MSGARAIPCDVILGEGDTGLAIGWDGPAPAATGLRIDSAGLWLLLRRGAPLRLGQTLDEASRAALSALSTIPVALVPADGGEPVYLELPVTIGR